MGYDLYSERFGQANIAAPALIKNLLAKATSEVEGHKFSSHFLFGEWTDVIDAWQLKSWEAYRDVSRLGRKTRIGGKQREILWAIFERVRAGLAEKKAVTLHHLDTIRPIFNAVRIGGTYSIPFLMRKLTFYNVRTPPCLALRIRCR